MVERPSKTTLSLAGLKAIASTDPRENSSAYSSPPPSVMKQFAAQAIVDFYTDWEEHYRRELARTHHCSKYDFQID